MWTRRRTLSRRSCKGRGCCDMLHRPSVRNQRAQGHARQARSTGGGSLCLSGGETGESDPATQASHLPRAVLSADVLNLMCAEYRGRSLRELSKVKTVRGVEVREIEARILDLGNGVRELLQAEPTHHVLRTVTPSNAATAVASQRVVHILAHPCRA